MSTPSQLVASQRKSGAAAHATSRTCSARNRHVLVPATRARFARGRASSAVMICTTVGGCAARSSRSICDGRQHFGAVLEHAASRDDVAGGNRDGVVDVAVLEIELALAEIRIGVPAAHVVVDGHARIPLRDLVERAVAAHAVGAVLGNDERVLHADGRACRRAAASGASRSMRIIVSSVLPTTPRPLTCEARDVVAALKSADAPARIAGKQRRAFAAVPVEILVELQPDEAKGVGRIVGVANADGAANRLRGRVERRGDGVVGALLPVRPGRARQSPCDTAFGPGHSSRSMR